MEAKGVSRKQYTAEFKYKVAVEATYGQKTLAEICSQFGVALTQVKDWKKQLRDNGSLIFEQGHKPSNNSAEAEIDRLHTIIGKIKVENDFLERALKKSH